MLWLALVRSTILHLFCCLFSTPDNSVSSCFGARNTIAGSWSFPGAAGQLPGPSSGRPTGQHESFSWLKTQHLQPASYTLHLQHRSSPPARWLHVMYSPFLSSSSISLLTSWLMLFSPPSSHLQYRNTSYTLPVQSHRSQRWAAWGGWCLLWHAS